MQITKEINNSKDSGRGFLYQAYVGLKYALSDEYRDFKTIYFEHFGDVSFDNTIQIECKHKKKKTSLSDTSDDFWNSLHNWIVMKTKFEKYALFTVAHFPIQRKAISKLSKWNKSTKEERLEILKKIKFSYSLDEITDYKIFKKNLAISSNFEVNTTTIETLRKNMNKKFTTAKFKSYLDSINITEKEKEILLKELKNTSDPKFDAYNNYRFVLSCDERLILPLLEKIEIITKQPNDEELQEQLATFPIFKELESKYNIKEIKALIEKIAAIIYSKSSGSQPFDYTGKQFFKIIADVKRNYYKENYRPIFDKYHLAEAPSNISETFKNYKFVNELNQIRCESDELDDAVVDFWKTNMLLIEEEENSSGFTDGEFKSYKFEVWRKLRTKKREYPKSENSNKNSKNSLEYYRSAKQIPFLYKSIPDLEYFKHGTMQNIVENNEKDFSWIL